MNFAGAVLAGCELTRTVLCGADLVPFELRGSIVDGDTRFPMGVAEHFFPDAVVRRAAEVILERGWSGPMWDLVEEAQYSAR